MTKQRLWYLVLKNWAKGSNTDSIMSWQEWKDQTDTNVSCPKANPASTVLRVTEAVVGSIIGVAAVVTVVLGIVIAIYKTRNRTSYNAL